MANATIRNAVSIHGTNPQHLIEKPVRYRIYSSPFWKEHCFALSASTILPLAVDLSHIGGLYALQRPSPFLCLLQKLLQIQPSPAIIRAYLRASDFKYLRALTAFYIRLTYQSKDVYRLLEPMLEDYRKLRWRRGDGGYEVVCMDEWVDTLLREERVCDIILPRLTKREVCEQKYGLAPRISKLETNLIRESKREESDESEGSEDDVKRWKLQRLRAAARREEVREETPEDLGEEVVYTSQEESEEEEGERKRRRFISPSPSVSPDRQVQGFVSRSPSRSPDREFEEGGYVSRSPSLSPDRDAGYVSRSPSLSPDRT